MSNDTQAHLFRWVDRHVATQDQINTLSDMLTVLRDHPDLVKTHTWTEVRTLAQRS